jgi:hypothetical protein
MNLAHNDLGFGFGLLKHNSVILATHPLQVWSK